MIPFHGCFSSTFHFFAARSMYSTSFHLYTISAIFLRLFLYDHGILDSKKKQ